MLKLEGVEAVGSAVLLNGSAICGGFSKPISEEALIGLGKAGLSAPLALCANVRPDHELKTSAWPRIKPKAVSLESLKRTGVI